VPHDAHEEHRDGDRDEHPVADVRVEAERAHIGELLRGDTRCARFEGSPLQRKAPARNGPKCYASSSLRWARKG
jgi:hypothetical protein